MSRSLLRVRRKAVPLATAIAAGILMCTPAADARVTRIIVDSTTPIAGQPYEQPTGRAFGELDPNDPHNAIITDIALAPKNAKGEVEYIASFRIRKPTA